ncbi:MAG: hypothetical protein KIT11_08125 [Fimbriimonadaceae bacterium]|nr:hypothetical protein [Fimbriimonadaceae bacterium]QYK56321.1 MAG: hypothetical protein KF733_02320 [Fimbriimonadaceae bacterium]
MAGRKKRTPYLANYLDWCATQERAAMATSMPLIGCGTTVVAGTLTFLASNAAFGTVNALLLAGLTGAVATWIVTALAKAASRKEPVSDKTRRGWESARGMKSLADTRKLHKWMDLPNLEVLDAAAFHWSRIHGSLNQAPWTDQHLPEHWVRVRGQALAAANEAMADLTILASQVVGPPSRDKEQELVEIVEDLFDLDIKDALQGLKSMTSGDWREYTHKSPQSKFVFSQARPIAERLQSLADEIERASVEVREDMTPLDSYGSNKSLDAVLSELRAIRQAEDELEQRLGQ